MAAEMMGQCVRLTTATLVALVLGGPAAHAETAAPMAGEMPWASERFAFDLADSDGDGRINEAELAADAAAGFAGLDRDGSGTLAPEELGPHDPALFEKVDANKDGLLTFEEVMNHKMRALRAGDRDGDGGLTLEEMVEIVQRELEGTP
jgi:Ca2+-binding EF-hand superfamily protein